MARCTWTDIAIAGQTPSAMARSQSLASLLEAHAKLDLLARSEVGQRRLNDFASIAQRFIRAPTELPAQPFAAHRTGAANGGAWRREKLVGLVLTHGHEDHIGAVAAMWPQLRCPLFATPFTAHLLRLKLAHAGLASVAQIVEVAINGRASVGPFQLKFIGVTHSTIEAHSVVIETPLGRVLHTGDWKLDPDPRVGPATNESAFRALAQPPLSARRCAAQASCCTWHVTRWQLRT